jgi:hypothetical protein
MPRTRSRWWPWVTGTGRALAATHAPAHVQVAAVADSVLGEVASGKNDV